MIIAGCSGGKESSTTEKKTTASTTSPATSGEWRDVPLYLGAREKEKFSVTLPSKEELKEIEYKFYESKDKMEKIADFYKLEMPKRGWEGSFLIASDFANGYYEKKEEKIIATIFLREEKNVVSIGLAAGTKK